MAERRIINGTIYEKGDDGQIRAVGPAQTGGVFSLPPDAQQQAGINKAVADATGQAIHNHVEGATAPAVIAKTGAEAETAGQKTRFNGLDPQVYNKALAQYNSANQLDTTIADLAAHYAAGPGSTHGLGSVMDYLPFTANQQFDRASNSARGIVRNALGLTGGEANTANEAQMNLGAYIPQASDRDATIEDSISRLAELRDKARREAIQTLGGIPDPMGNIRPVQAPNAMQQPSLSEGAVPAAAFGATTGSTTPIPRAMQDEYNGYIAAHAGNIDPKDYVQFRMGLDTKYNMGRDADTWKKYLDEATKFNDAVKRGGHINTTIPAPERPLSQAERFRNNLVNNPVGAGVAGFADAGSLGVVGALTQDKMGALTAAHPTAVPVGQILGSIGGTSLVGKVGSAAARKIAPWALKAGTLADLARGVATDAAYGGVYGGLTNGDPLTGAVAGAGGSVLGQVAGKAAGGLIGGVAASDAVKALRARGIPLTAGQALGGSFKAAEDGLTSLPFAGDIVAARRLDGLRAFNQKAFAHAGEPIGASVQNTGEQGVYDLLGVDGNKGAVGQAYDAATAGVRVPLDPSFAADMAAARRSGASLPSDLSDRFGMAISNRVAPIEQAGELTGDSYQQAVRGLKGYRAEHTRPGFEQDYRDALTVGMDALTGQMSRGGGLSVTDGIAAADQAYRRSKVLQKAVAAAKNGKNGEMQLVSPADINNAAQQSVNKFGGRRPFADLTDPALEVMPSRLPDSGTARRLILGTLATGAGAGAGAGLGYNSEDGSVLGGAAAGMTVPVGLLAALALGGTKTGQGWIVKGLLDRPDALEKAGRYIGDKSRRIGSASVIPAINGSR